MSSHRPPGMRGRGRARYRDSNTPSPTPGHQKNKDRGDGSESPSAAWKHDRYDRHAPGENDEGTNSPVTEATDSKREPVKPERQRKADRGRNRRPDVQVYVPRARRQQTGPDITSPQRSTTSAKTDHQRKVRPGREVYVPKHQQQQHLPHHDDSITTTDNHDSINNINIPQSKSDQSAQQSKQDPEGCSNDMEVDLSIHPSKKIKVFDKRKHFEKYMQKVDYQSFPAASYHDSDEENSTNISTSHNTDNKTSQECNTDTSMSQEGNTDNNMSQEINTGNNTSKEGNTDNNTLQEGNTDIYTSQEVKTDNITSQYVRHRHCSNVTESVTQVDGYSESRSTPSESTGFVGEPTNPVDFDGVPCDKDRSTSPPATDITSPHLNKEDQVLQTTDKINIPDSEPYQDTAINCDVESDRNTENTIKSEDGPVENVSSICENRLESKCDLSASLPNDGSDTETTDCKQDPEQNAENVSNIHDTGENTSDAVSRVIVECDQTVSIENKFNSNDVEKHDVANNPKESNTVIDTINSEESIERMDQIEEVCSTNVEENMSTDVPTEQNEKGSSDLNTTKIAPCDKDVKDSNTIELTRRDDITPADGEVMDDGNTSTSTDPVPTSNQPSEEPEEDSWDAMFNDEGDCLDPKALDELTKTVGNVKIQKSKKINYLDYQPKDKGNFDYTQYAHIIEIYDFPKEFVTRDLIMAFQSFMSRGFDLKWVDDTHALGIFSSAIAAQDALMMIHPLVKVRSLLDASKPAQDKARRCTEFLQPYKPRPETTASAARRLVAGALGLASKVPREKREQERQQLKEAKEKRRKDRKNREDIWEFGKCAMDEDN